MTNIKIVPATEELTVKFYGFLPPKTIKAFAAVKEDDVVGIAGMFKAGLVWMLFSDMKQDVLNDKRAMVTALRSIRKLVDNARIPVYAKADENAEGAETLISHIDGVELWPR